MSTPAALGIEPPVAYFGLSLAERKFSGFKFVLPAPDKSTSGPLNNPVSPLNAAPAAAETRAFLKAFSLPPFAF